MPQMTIPGTTSRVWLTTLSSALFMSRAAMPGAPFTSPSLASLFTPVATTAIIKLERECAKDTACGVPVELLCRQ